MLRFVTKSTAEAKKFADDAVKADSQSWRRLLVLAEIISAINPEDALSTPLLVKVGKFV